MLVMSPLRQSSLGSVGARKCVTVICSWFCAATGCTKWFGLLCHHHTSWCVYGVTSVPCVARAIAPRLTECMNSTAL
jgi:hypothetical protein